MKRLAPYLLLGCLFAAVNASGQVLSGLQNVNLNAALAESLTVTVTGGSTVNFSLVPGGVANGDTAVTIDTSWVLRPNRGAVSLYGYFDSAAAALTDGEVPANDIPTSSVLGRVTTGDVPTYTAFTQSNPVGPAGAGLRFYSETILGNNKNKTRTDTLDLQIDLTALPQLPAGTYAGTLRIQARAL